MKFWFAVLACAIFCFSTPKAQAETLVFATGEWRPYTSKDMEGQGEYSKLVSLVAAEMGYKAEFRFYPWSRCYDAVVKGRVWAAFPYSYTEGRAKEVWFSQSMDRSRSLLFSYQPPGKERKIVFNSLKDLAPYRLGGVSGYFYQEMFDQAGLNVEYVNTEFQGLEKLLYGRIDLFPVNDKVGWDIIRTRFPGQSDNFQTLPKPLSDNELSLIVSREYPGSAELLRKFNAALRRCREKGLIPE